MSINHPSLGQQTLDLERELLYRQAIAASTARQAARLVSMESESGASTPAPLGAVLNAVRLRQHAGFLVASRATALVTGN